MRQKKPEKGKAIFIDCLIFASNKKRVLSNEIKTKTSVER